ncbi:hypothetical protein DFA_04768 [Cavenderia fasciculata]|uniref:DUF2804 family protein n=1 Tax=Cavenderia fasciculata TaxID=261658 RepID=F4PQH5_CACFS|nr:uncharacterized protein DFA_04768 [Cavenderia fasciculata]EGG22638.1 hypothetical protein DFA_04768 [Cavenderia fasciculata]|eukprot:XP_004360489.1 hypothetical protein DFA_04768 [Cavenderia fasciculata]
MQTLSKIASFLKSALKVITFPLFALLILYEKLYRRQQQQCTFKSYQDPCLENQQEIKEKKGDLLGDDGKLVCCGWSRNTMFDYNPSALSLYQRMFRLKEWSYYAVGSETFYFAVAAVDLGYAINYQTFYIDYENPANTRKDQVVIPGFFRRGRFMPKDSCLAGNHIQYNSKSFKIHFHVNDHPLEEEEEEGSSSTNHQHGECTTKMLTNESKHLHFIEMASEKMKTKVKMEFDVSPTRESMVLATRIGENKFYYNRKTNLIPVKGSLLVDGVEHLSDQYDGNRHSFGILDWGRGVWEYNSFWIWCTTWKRMDDGRTIGFNFGSGFGDLRSHTENCVNIDGVIHKLGHVEIKYNKDNLQSPWTFTCPHGRFGDAPITFTPITKKLEVENFIVVSSHFSQIIGHFAGTVILDNGEKITFDNMYGFSEVHYARW